MLSTFIELPFVIGIFVLSIFEWPFKTSFTVYQSVHEVSVLIASASSEGSAESAPEPSLFAYTKASL